MLRKKYYRWVVIAATVLVLIVALRTCRTNSDLVDEPTGEKVDAALTLRTVTLEQPDEDGNLLWRIKAKSVNYSPDSQQAKLLELEGEFFQAGNVIYTVEADEGEVRQNGETLYLRGNLVATSTEGELTVESERLKWQPKQDLLVMGNFEDDVLEDDVLVDAVESEGDPSDRAGNESNETRNEELQNSAQPEEDSLQDKPVGKALTTQDLLDEATLEKAPVRGFNPQMEAIAQVASVSNKNNRVELTGGVAAKSQESPWLTFATEQLTWLVEQERIQTDQPLTVEQYQSEDYAQVSDRVIGAKGNVQLADNIVTLDESVQLESLAQSLKVSSAIAVWDVDAQTVSIDSQVNIEQSERKVTASANSANLDLAQKVVYLTGDVRANGEENDSRLQADRVVWKTQSQDVEAEGNVQYEQAASPAASIAGEKAVGNLEQGTLVILSGESGDVVTEIVPKDLDF